MSIFEKKWRIYLCGGANCGPLSRAILERTLNNALWELELDGDVDIRMSSCQNRCEYAPNLTIWPGPFRYAQLTSERIHRIVAEHLRQGQPIHEWLVP